MARRKKGLKIDGWVNLDKPDGLTSTQALGKVRRVLNAQKAGHAGTLDPIATGVLPIALGSATKTIPYAQDAIKTYSFTVTWGEQRDTDDREGQVVATSDHRPVEQDIKDALTDFVGTIQQTPPQFSAIKIDGQRAYDLARAGETVEIKSREVFIESLECLATRAHEADFIMTCGKGTYVRSLARDLAKKLGTCGYISVLRRERVGCFSAEDAISLDILEQMDHSAALGQAVLPLDTVLDDIPALDLKDEEAGRLRNGQVLSFVSRPDFERLVKAGLGESEDVEAVARTGGQVFALVDVCGAEIRPFRILK